MLNRKKKEKEKRGTFHTSEVVFLLLITCFISVLMGVVCRIGYEQNNKEEINGMSESLKKIVENYNYIVDNYYKDVDPDVLAKGAINGMIAALGDNYSNIIDEESLDNFNKQLEGSFFGVGIEITNNKENNVEIVSVFKDSPADQAGLQSGDIVLEVDGTNFLGKSMSEVTKFISEQKNNKIQMKVQRNEEEKVVELRKTKVIIPSVNGKLVEKEGKKVGYIAIDTFSNTTYLQFKTVLNNLEEQGIQGLMIDVRGNSGGHLTAAENILSLFLDQKHVIYQTETKTNKKKVYSSGKTTKKYPITILQNLASASASELLAAAFQESYGAKVIGTNSYGKGTIQELVSLSDTTEYKFTTKKWLTPNGNWVNEKGVQPDVTVDMNEEYKLHPSEETDNQFQTALSETVNRIR